MSGPKRWIEEGGPEGASDLLRAAWVPRPMNEAENARSLDGVRRLASIAPTGHWGAWAKAALGMAGVGAGLLLLAKAPDRASVRPASISAEPVSPVATTDGAASVVRLGVPDEQPKPVAIASLSAAESANAPRLRSSPPSAAKPAGTTPRPLPRASATTPTPVAPGAPALAYASPDDTPGVAVEDSMLREAHLLERARQSLGVDPAAALVVCEEHARLFPQGQLHAERDLVEAEALRRLGRYAGARALARSLEQASPFYAARARRLLESMPRDDGPAP
jgi:hypothetical protein